MKTTISVAKVLQIGGCTSGIQQAVDLGAKVGIKADDEVDFNYAIQVCERYGDDFVKKYLIENKAALLEYTNAQLDCYLLNGKEFADLESVTQAAKDIRNEREQYHLNLTTVAFSHSINEDAAWYAIDIDTFEIPEGVEQYHFHVFNHMTGSYEEAYTIEEVKTKKQQIVAAGLERDKIMWKIMMRSVFQEDGVSTKIEEVNIAL